MDAYPDAMHENIDCYQKYSQFIYPYLKHIHLIFYSCDKISAAAIFKQYLKMFPIFKYTEGGPPISHPYQISKLLPIRK